MQDKKGIAIYCRRSGKLLLEMQVNITLHTASKNIPKTTGLLSDELGPELGPYIRVAE